MTEHLDQSIVTDEARQLWGAELRGPISVKHGEPLDYFVTLVVRTTITAVTMREAFEEARSKLPLEFELRRFDVEGKD